MSNWVLLEKVNLVQDEDPMYPLSGFSFSEISGLIKDLHFKYPECSDFKYELNWKSHGYGAVTRWYELQGLTEE